MDVVKLILKQDSDDLRRKLSRRDAALTKFTVCFLIS
jgi:hypothetical protein